MNHIQKFKTSRLVFAITLLSVSTVFAQKITDFKIQQISNTNKTGIINQFQFNGYTNHWQNSYTEIYRYANLFKMPISNVQSTILQSKINIADDLGIPGLLVQEGFVSKLLSTKFQKLENITLQQLEDELKTENVLVITNQESEAGKKLLELATPVFEWTTGLKSYQFNDPNLETVKAFYLVSGVRHLFVISSNSIGTDQKN
jgi:hypothetical protein